MNILLFHVNGIVPTAGGISRTTYNLVKLFRDKGHEVWLIGAKDINGSNNYDVHQHFLPSPQQAASDTNYNYLQDIVRKYKIDVVINQYPFSQDYVNLLDSCRKEMGVKVVSCYHNSILTPIYNFAYQKEYTLKKNGFFILFWLLKSRLVSTFLTCLYKSRYRSLFRNVVDKSDSIVLLCDGQVEEWKRMCGSIDYRKATIIPNYDFTSDAYLSNEKENIVLWIGTFDCAIKRPDLMLRIWEKVESEHTDWNLYMLGDGPSYEKMISLSKRLGLKHVVFLGRVIPTDYYRRAKIECMTSIHEAFPMVAIESMSAGMPVISFNSYTSAPDIIINKKNGILVEPFDVRDYVRQLGDLMNDKQRLNEMGKFAKESVERFSPTKVYYLWQQLFERLRNSL